MKKIIGIFLLLIFFSCEKEKTEFIQSKIDSTLVLIKNPLENDLILKKEIINFIKHKKKKLKKEDNGLSFYKYTSGTSYFLNNANYDGFGAKILSKNEDDNLAIFTVLKCRNDTTKFVGRLHFYGNAGIKNDLGEIDTLIYKCN
ncbi:hypothetical protein GCM10023210_21150 [Chryseobacterium ginsengisoli]|uniref:Lipoprotein n=1 Tax=Chryseobacterium ginsengisoli TaxID=363853 RepID=A0ABP9M8K8_9FLAO